MRKLFVSAFALLSVSVLPAVHAAEVLDSQVLSKIGPESDLNEIKDKIDSTEISEKSEKVEPTNIPEKATQISEEPLPFPGEQTPSKEIDQKKDEGVSALPVLDDKSEADKSPEPDVKVPSSKDSGVSAIPSDLDKASVTNAPVKAEPANDSKVLKLKRLESKEFFNSPNAFISVLNPGYWHEVPQKAGDGWEGSLLVIPEILDCLISKDANKLADILIKKDALPAFRNGAIQAIRSAMDSIREKDVLHYLKISEIMAYEDILRNNGLFERYQSTIEDLGKRPHIGINVWYSSGLSFDIAKVRDLYKTRIGMAKKIEDLEKSLKDESDKRADMISPEMQSKLSDIQKIVEQNAELSKKIEEIKLEHKAEIEKAEADKKSGEDKLAKAKQLPETTTKISGNGRRKTITIVQNPGRVSDEKAANEIIRNAEEKLTKLKAGYAEFEKQMENNSERIKELEEDEDVASARAIDKTFDKKLVKILDQIKECYMRLAYMDPEHISSSAIKFLKLPKELKGKVDELAFLKKSNEELSKKIEAKKSDKKTEIEDAEADKKSGEDKLAKAKQLPETIPQTTGNGKNKRTTNVQNPGRVSAEKAANEIIRNAKEKLTNLKAGYAEFEKQMENNSERIKELESDEKVMNAKMIVDNYRAEQQEQEIEFVHKQNQTLSSDE